MTITLRPHQVVAINDVNRLKLNPVNKAILCVLPTGAGKSLTLADYARNWHHANEKTIVFAHRDKLISQLSEALCKMGVPHGFICSDKAKRDITNRNLKLFGDSYYDELSPIIISSNPTFAARLKNGKLPMHYVWSVQHWIQDEAHHVTMDSQLWGSCLKALKNADGLGFTATPIRGDKKGLGSHADGIFDAMSVTTNMWELIQKQMLSAYKIYIPPTKVDLSGLNATSGGDYNQKQVAGRVDKREITGDAVEHYLRVAKGQRAITFCVNIEHARHVAEQFNKAGVPSAAVSSKDSDAYIQQTMESFDNGLILNLVNVDLLGEGYDSPSISVGIMLRPTQSYSLFKQHFGRILRTAEGKTHGILLDHVGNVQFMMKQYNLTYIHDDPEWTLDRGTKRAKNDDGEKLVDTHTCPKCRFFWIVADHGDTCPDCGHDMTVKEREAEQRAIQVTEGELVELSCDIIDELMREREKVDMSMEQFSNTTRNLPAVARHSANNSHAKRLHAQGVLRHAIQNWCEQYGFETGFGVDTVRNQFQVTFGISVFHAQVLSERKALELTERIQQS